MSGLTDAALAQELQPRLAECLEHFLAAPSRRGRDEWKWTKTHGYIVQMTGARAGYWFHADGTGGRNPLSLLAHFLGDRRKASREARAFLGLEDSTDRPAQPAPRIVVSRDTAADKEDQDKRIRRARRIWSETRNVAGTLSERYVREARGIPGQLPSREIVGHHAGLWHPHAAKKFPALVLAARDVAGEVVAVQAVFLDRDTADKIRLTDGEGEEIRAKLSFGAVRGNAVRLRELAEGPVVLAEGPEDALTAFAALPAASVRAMLGTFGNARHLDDLAGRDVVFAGQTDAPNSPAARATAKAAAEIEGRAAAVRVAMPAPGAGKDINDLCRAAGLDAVTGALAFARPWREHYPTAEPAPAAAPKTPTLRRLGRGVKTADAATLPALSEQVAAAQARATLAANVAAALSAPVDIITVEQADPGAGKTRATLEAIAVRKTPEAAYIYAVSETKRSTNGQDSLGEELLKQAQALGIRTVLYAGRNAGNCAAYDVVGPLQDVGIRASSVCGKKDGIPGETACPHRERCALAGYLSQLWEIQAAELIIIPHALLSADWSKSMLRDVKPAAIIIDEAFADSVAKSATVPADTLLTSHEKDAEKADQDPRVALNKAILKALEERKDPARTIHADPSLRAALEAASEAVDAMDAEDVGPYTTPEQARAIATRRRGGTVRAERKMLRILAERVADLDTRSNLPASRSLSLVVERANGEPRRLVRVAWKSSSFAANISGQQDDGTTDPRRVVILDASARRPIVERLFPGRGIVWHSIRIATPNTRIIQVPDYSNAPSSLIASEDADEATLKKASRRLDAVFRTLDTLASRHPGGVLVCCPKRVRDALERVRKASGQPWPANVELGHFGALRGKNRWKGFEAVIVVGRQEPTWEALDAMHAALAPEEEAPPAFGMVPAIYRGTNGRAWTKQIRGIAEPLAQSLLEVIREEEIAQAVARLRLADRTEEAPATVYVMTSVPLPSLPVDDLMTAAELRGEAHPLAEVSQECGDVLLLSPSLLSGAVGAKFAHLGTTDKALKFLRKFGISAEAMLYASTREKPADLYKDLYTIAQAFPSKPVQLFTAGKSLNPLENKDGLQIQPVAKLVRFRFIGQRGSDTAAIVFGSQEPRAALIRILAAQGLTLGAWSVVATSEAAAAPDVPAVEQGAADDFAERLAIMSEGRPSMSPGMAAAFVGITQLHEARRRRSAA